jgi:hypothetical protein
MIDKAFNKLALGFALFFMVCELTYVNAKSLLYMVSGFDSIDKFFAVIGSLAFSMVTVVVMRKTTKQWVKVVFPVFDTLLVFCGFNLHYADAILDGSDNPVRFWLSVFMALFTGFITYCLGLINYNEHTQGNENETNKEFAELRCIIIDSETKQNELNRIISELTKKQSETQKEADEWKESTFVWEGKYNESEKKLNKTKTIANQYLRNHILYESWLGKKKSETNRNGNEAIMDKLADRIKQGETITIDEYTKCATN